MENQYQQTSCFEPEKLVVEPNPHEFAGIKKTWRAFAQNHTLSDEQLKAFQRYADHLLTWNKRFNLTAVTSLSELISQHFSDSFALADAMDLSKITTIADIGTGAGFPSLPIKIMHPHLKMVLIEVNGKKREFLKHIVELLGLENVEVCALDWRTFLRKTTNEIDLFVTKAALDEVELARIFRTTSHYRDKKIVYWVSEAWQCHKYAEKFLNKVTTYSVKRKKRKLAFLMMPEEISSTKA